MGKINNAAFTGFLLCFVAIFFGIVTNGGIESVVNLIHIPSFIVTFGGALFAVLMTADSFVDFQEERNRKNINFWQDLGSYGPAWGMLGTLLGLINMMKSMGSNVDAIGAGMSLALITTLYGSMLANWICTPIGRKLEKSSNEELLIMEVVTEGVLSIQAGENTRIIREKIKSVIEMETKEEEVG